MSSLCLLPYALSELFAQVSTTHTVTQADRFGLLAALLEEHLSDDDRQALDRILYAVRKGHIQMVSELSATPRA